MHQILSLLSGRRFSLDHEKALQQGVADLLLSTGFTEGADYTREYRLTNKDIPDFYFHSQRIAIEIKVKGQARAIYAQCGRYCDHTDVNQLLLITNKSMGFPKEINGKPCYVLNLGQAWL